MNLRWLPFRWAPFWGLIGLHNPTRTFDHERAEPVHLCFWCGYSRSVHQGRSLYCIDRDRRFKPLH